MKKIVVMVMTMAMPGLGFADERRVLHAIEALKLEVAELKLEIKKLTNIVQAQGASVTPVIAKQWGCYVRAIEGTYYGSAPTRAEAAGRALASCGMKENLCSENRLECSSSD